MSTHANRVKMTTATTGTGTITLGSAAAGYQTFGAGFGNVDATVDILITEGSDWEIARNCIYTHSGTTLTRGTWEDSSNGTGAITLAGSAVVSVIATAAFGNNAALNHVAASPTSAGVTGVVGTMHLLDISGLTASRNFTLPATAAVGDRVGVYITTGDDANALIIIGDTGDTINGGSANTEWSRLFITNECVILRCTAANSAWVVEYDGRIPCVARIEPGATQSLTNGQFDTMTLGSVIVDVGALTGTANTITIRRSGEYAIYGGGAATPSASATALATLIWSVYKAGSEYLRILRTMTDNVGGTGSTGGGGAVRPVQLAAADALTLRGYINQVNYQTEYIAGTSVVFLSVQEQL